MTIQEFYEKLEQHDWYYTMSDDYSVWAAAKNERAMLEYLGDQYGYTIMLHDYGRFMASGGKLEKPKIEDYI